MNNINVLIIDEWDIKRGEEFAKLFKRFHCRVFKMSELKSTPSAIPSILLYLIHIGDNYDERTNTDRKLFNKNPLKQTFNAKATIIWYGGNKGIDKRLSNSVEANKNKIWKKIYSAEDVKLNVTAEDAQALIAYAQAKMEGKTQQKPTCLLPPNTHFFLMSFAILCQGYLIANCFTDGGEVSPSLKKAITCMNYDPTMFFTLKPDAVENTQNRNWWKNPFLLTGDEIAQKIKGEWVDGKIKACLEEIYDDQKETKLVPSLNIAGQSFMDIIAQSYVAIAVYLRRNP